MADTLHSPTPEDLMEYLDGEGTASSRAAIEAHLATCAACQAFAAEQKGLSRELGTWQVAPAPDTLRAAVPARPRWTLPAWLRQPRAAALALSGVAVVMIVAGSRLQIRTTPRAAPPEIAEVTDGVLQTAPTSRKAGGGKLGMPVEANGPAPPRFQASPAQAPEEQKEVDKVTTVRALIRTATLQIVATDFGSVRQAVERIVADASGFADQMSVSADPGSARVLRATLRVPGDQLSATLDRLRGLGQVTGDQQTTQDVSDQIIDLDARLKNARATEQRLTDILRERTGKLSDVLEVEQELARVRLEIEQLDAQKTNTTRRVACAAIDVTISEARKAGLDSGPLPLLTQARIAAADGLQNAIDTVVGVTLFVLRAGPTLGLWIVAALIGWVAVKRLRRRVHSI